MKKLLPWIDFFKGEVYLIFMEGVCKLSFLSYLLKERDKRTIILKLITGANMFYGHSATLKVTINA